MKFRFYFVSAERLAHVTMWAEKQVFKKRAYTCMTASGKNAEQINTSLSTLVFITKFGRLYLLLLNFEKNTATAKKIIFVKLIRKINILHVYQIILLN